MIVFGLKLWTWGNALTPNVIRCGSCGQTAQFFQKKGMQFITLYWVIPTIPVSGVKDYIQCPNCKARYEAQAPI